MSNSPCALQNVPQIPQQVILDDRSSAITYNGPWTADAGRTLYNWGISFNDTTHHVNVSSQPASLSFQFQGTAFSIIGSVIVNSTTPTNGALEFNRTCHVDGSSNFNSSDSDLLCQVDNLPDGTHNVDFSVATSIDDVLSVEVDAIQYTPTTSELKASHPGVLLVDICDPSVDYGQTASSWATYKAPSSIASDPTLGYGSLSRGISTNIHGTQLSYNFIGTKIQAIATVLSIDAGGSAITNLGWANFTLDGQTSSVQVPLPMASLTEYNHIIWDSDTLAPGSHSLVVSYDGDTDTLPLLLSYLVVYPSYTTSSSKSHLGPILGGVLGGICGLILALVVAWLGYSRRQRKMEKRAWSVTWRNRTSRSDAMEMMSSPRPEKTNF